MTDAVCRNCKYFRQRARVRPFAAADLIAPGVLKEQSTWEQEERQRAQQEYQAYLARQPFTYEPHNYAWCEHVSRRAEVEAAGAAAARGDRTALDRLLDEGAALVDPVTGDVTPIYQLCAWQNPEGRCEFFVSGEG